MLLYAVNAAAVAQAVEKARQDRDAPLLVSMKTMFLGVVRLNVTYCKNSNVLRSQQANYDMAERLGDRM